MVVRFVGRAPIGYGKRLFDILGNLNHFGVGRIVYQKTLYDRFAEKSYYIIAGVESCDLANEKSDKFCVNALHIYRGENRGVLSLSQRSALRPDWWLVPRADEADFLRRSSAVAARPPLVIPSNAPLPPVLQRVLQRDLKLDAHHMPVQINLTNPFKRVVFSSSSS